MSDMAGANRARPTNPFATRYTKPGRIPYLFPDGSSLAQLTDQLAAWDWRAAIVGPHGSGKTTLLEQLLPECERRGRRGEQYTLHDGQRNLPPGWHSSWSSSSLIAIDGYEQLSWWSRQLVVRNSRRSQCGLLVTSHRPPVELPVLHCTSADADRVLQIVAHLTRTTGSPVTADDIRTAFQLQGGNVREVLFALYDIHQSRS